MQCSADTRWTARSFVIDNERKVLYILYKETDAIEVVYLGSQFNSYKSICTLSTIKENAIQICRQQSRIFSPSDFDIETLHVISKAESKNIHLMAVTTTGHRLYFSHHKDSFRAFGNSSNLPIEPNTLELGHVRSPPPTLTRNAGELAPTYYQTYYDCGMSVSIIPKTEDSSSLRITSVTSAKAATAAAPSAQPQVPTSSISMMAMVRRYWIGMKGHDWRCGKKNRLVDPLTQRQTLHLKSMNVSLQWQRQINSLSVDITSRKTLSS